MVLFKRKAISFKENPTKLDGNAEVWVMPKSNEIYTDYESYLKRYDFFAQKKFTDAVNGKSNMTYFDAVDSETNSSSDIDKIFPDALRDPILRKVQFSNIGRIDELTTWVYDLFKNDFFPGEEVFVLVDESDNLEGTIREKARFPQLYAPDGTLQREAFSRYFVRLKNATADEALLDDNHVKRGRNVFTKSNIRIFLKNSLQREKWTGAPWLVKEPLAVQYRLPMEIPAHLQQGAQRLDRQSLSGQTPIPAHFNSVKGRKGKNLTAQDFSMEQLAMQHDQQTENGQTYSNQQYDLTPSGAKQDAPKVFVPKFPIDDLDVPPDRSGNTRPRLKFLAPTDGSASLENGLQNESVGVMLEVWNTLNVQCEVYQLDSFTFDDFVDAMRFSHEDIACELLDEMHCAVLKQIVDTEGEVQVHLPEMVADSEDEDSEEEDESEPATPVDVPAHATRSRLSQVQNAAEDEDDEMETSEHRQRPHRAAEMLADYGWVQRLQARDFGRGGWQTVMIGLLYQLSLDVRHKHVCESILSELAPLDEDATQATARSRYITLDVNLRIAALGVITRLSLTTKAFRTYLESCSEDMTATRKIKLEHQKSRKEAITELAKLEDEKRLINPDRLTDTNGENGTDTHAMNGDVDDTIETNGTAMSDPEDEDVTSARSLRKGHDRAAERKRKRDEDTARKEKERLEKAEASKVSNKQLKEYKRVLKEMERVKEAIRESEQSIIDCDRDLREANCQRTKVLGKDRFWNRYYWFERNGMPYEGLPTSSTASYEYANARIWVQGPDDVEREGFIDLQQAEMSAYSATHGLTVPERKKNEEGTTRLRTATDWGYYDDPDSIDALLGWLDDRGRREKELRKELATWRDDVVMQMGKLKDHLEAEKLKKEEIGESEQVTRVSTRHKTYVDVEALGQRCLKWKNSTMLEEAGHLHSEQAQPKAKKAKVDKSGRSGKGVAQVKVIIERSTRNGGRHGR